MILGSKISNKPKLKTEVFYIGLKANAINFVISQLLKLGSFCLHIFYKDIVGIYNFHLSLLLLFTDHKNFRGISYKSRQLTLHCFMNIRINGPVF